MTVCVVCLDMTEGWQRDIAQERNLFSVPSSPNLATARSYERLSWKTTNRKTFICWWIQGTKWLFWCDTPDDFRARSEERRRKKVLETGKKEGVYHKEKGYLKETGKDWQGVLDLNSAKGCIGLSCVFQYH